jgi:hypothetical protein
MRVERVGDSICARLRLRRAEIEQNALTRVQAVSDPAETKDPEYMQSLHTAISASLEYGLEALEHGEDQAPPVPAALLSQARLAARNRIPLDTVLRRYFAGYTLFGDLVVREVEKGGWLTGTSLSTLLRRLAAQFDHLIAVVSAEHTHECTNLLSSPDRRLLQRVRRLLEGAFVDSEELGYDLDVWHLGLVVAGPGAASLLHDLAKTIDAHLLLVRPEEGMAWAWFASREAIKPAAVARHLERDRPSRVSLTMGEPGHGVTGWRLTHRQAKACLSVALRTSGQVVSYADVALPAAILGDDLHVASFRQLYLAPLAAERDGGVALRKTLRAYLAAEQNVSSAAATLHVTRQTVSNRLRTVEGHLGRPLTTCMTELDTALRLEELLNE